jgi:hypothetical protein
MSLIVLPQDRQPITARCNNTRHRHEETPIPNPGNYLDAPVLVGGWQTHLPNVHRMIANCSIPLCILHVSGHGGMASEFGSFHCERESS